MFLNFKIQGEGQPLLLIHGLFGSLDNLGRLARALSDHYQVYQIDLPNHGHSPRNNAVDYRSQATAVKTFLDQQQLGQVSVVGHSMGGKVAMTLAILYPHRVDKLVVMDIAPVRYPVRRHDAVFAGLNESKQHIIFNRKDAENTLSNHIQDPGVRQFLLKSLVKQDDGSFDWQFNVEALESNYSDITDWPIKGQFVKRTLFLKGANSDYISAQHRENIEHQFPIAKAHVVSGTGHWLHAEKPETVSRVITRFLAKSER